MDPGYDNLIDDTLNPPSNKRQRTQVDDSANYFATPQASTSYVPPQQQQQQQMQEAPSPEEKKPMKGGKPPLPRGSACLLCRKRKLVSFRLCVLQAELMGFSEM